MSDSDSNSDVTVTNYGKTQTTVCPHCHQKVVSHKQWLGAHLVRALIAFYHAYKRGAGTPSRVVKQKSALDSFGKLRYFNLIDYANKRGDWVVSEQGERFILGKVSSVRALWTHQNRVVRVEDRRDYVNSIVDGFEYNRDMAGKPVDYVLPKVKSTGDIQADMFEEAA